MTSDGAAASSAGTIVVIGAGQAGGWTAWTLREQGYLGRILLFGDEKHPPHERPPLSKGILLGQSDPGTTHIFPAEKLAAAGVEWQPGQVARSLHPQQRLLRLADGSEVRYDQAVLCTGGRAKVPAVPGTGLPGVHTLRTIDDALVLRKAFSTTKQLIIIGGGWIGLEVAAAARQAGVGVTLVEISDRLCSRLLPKEISDFLHDLHAARGVQIVTGRGLAAIQTSGGQLCAELNGGERLAADTIVLAVGLQANDELARDAGIECRDGVLVDSACRTSDPYVLAAGDVARMAWNGERVRLESWRNAQDQAIVAAKVALGQDVRYEPVPWFWSDQYDVNLQIYGLPRAAHRTVVRGDVASGRFVAFLLEGDSVRAALGVNAGRQLGVARRLVARRASASDEALRNPEVSLASL